MYVESNNNMSEKLIQVEDTLNIDSDFDVK